MTVFLYRGIFRRRPSPPVPHDLARFVFEALARGDLAGAEAAAARLDQAGAAGEAAHARALVRALAGQTEAALPFFALARRLLPDRADVAYDHGVVLIGQGRRAEARAAWAAAVELDPGRADAWLNLALVSGELEGEAAAGALYRAALAHHPAGRHLRYNLGNLLFRAGDAAGAAEHFTALVAAHPADAAGWINLGMALKAGGDPDGAEMCYRRAIALGDPDWLAESWFNLGNLLLAQRRWAEGFAAYEWRRRLSDAPAPPVAAPDWTGAEPAGARVLLWSDQGLGDAIQYLRHAPALAARGVRVVALVPTALKNLAATAPGVAEALAPADPIGPVAAQIALGSLPHRLGLPDPFAPPPPYLHPRWGAAPAPPRPGGRRRIGLVWAGNPDHPYDSFRSIPPDALAPLLDHPGIDWVGLQCGAGRGRLAGSALAGRIEDGAAGLADLADTARALAGLDLLISVDTASAHLAGALGRPVWILLAAFGTDWRWGDGDATPLYPTARLFRQEAGEGWGPVVARLAAALGAPPSAL